MRTACNDRYQCALPDPATGQRSLIFCLSDAFFAPLIASLTSLEITTATIHTTRLHATGKYGRYCEPFDASEWSPALRPLAKLVQANDPSGIPGVNFMGGIVRPTPIVNDSGCLVTDQVAAGPNSTRD
jgi:hypothetical protein